MLRHIILSAQRILCSSVLGCLLLVAFCLLLVAFSLLFVAFWWLVAGCCFLLLASHLGGFEL
ncbi:hypothetical protein BJ875DRAFT_32336 [Amylocarpus encephaloides]|uniref:Uncharacterized protein n=1 Tax=Amylocarpus encephaloides TaxID=45428 RepID=A0A9P8CAV6_9HELO|nr:hypothetical protein BJ875DRAFT_32336 [Amylocarpus encephaloides]